MEEELPEREAPPQKRLDAIKKETEEARRAFEESIAARRAELKSRHEREVMEEEAQIAELRQAMDWQLENREKEARLRMDFEI